MVFLFRERRAPTGGVLLPVSFPSKTHHVWYLCNTVILAKVYGRVPRELELKCLHAVYGHAFQSNFLKDRGRGQFGG